MPIMRIKVNGEAPLLMQSDLMVDPLHPRTKAYKELTSKKKKTDSDIVKIAISEMRSYLYYNESLGVHIPSANIEASMKEGATINKLGTAVKRGIIVLDDAKLIYDGPSDPDELVRNANFQYAKSVVVNRNRVIRYRPIFKSWSLEYAMSYDELIFNRDNVIQIAENAGKFAGLGTWRPRFGRYSIEVLEG